MSDSTKTALVTGASRGIGACIAKTLAADGFDIVAHYSHNKDKAEDTANFIRNLGRNCSLLQADFLAESSVNRIIDELRIDKLDVLINNAGIIVNKSVVETTTKDFDQVINVNCKIPFFLTSQLLDRINENGRVINISTAGTRTYFPDIALYAASKGFLEVFTRHLAPLLAKKKITVNTISPGVTDTDMSAWVHDPESQSILAAIQAMPGLGKPENIAGLVSYLCSSNGGWITGQCIECSGGLKL